MKINFQSCLETYQEMVLDYNILYEKLRKEYGASNDEDIFDTTILNKSDYDKLQIKCKCIEAVEKVLGLTEAEIEHYSTIAKDTVDFFDNKKIKYSSNVHTTIIGAGGEKWNGSSTNTFD